MYNFNDANLQINKEEILKYVTELQIFERYCTNFNTLDSSFKSEFYKDNNPSCRIIISGSGIPYYKDFGNGEYFLAFDYVSRKYNSNYHETCNIIANDFNLKKIDVNISPQLLLNIEEKPKLIKIKSDIKVFTKPFDIIDYNYWNQYGISLQTLEFYNVKACSHVFLTKGDNHYVFEYKKDKPLYSYRFFKNNTEYFKIYNPYSDTKEGKWLSNVGSDCLQGYDQLDPYNDILILTKSLKDVMSYRELDYNAVGLQAETNKLSDKSFEELSDRFNKIIINFDNDNQGHISTLEYCEKYKLDYFYIEETKDISDYISKFGIEKAKQLIKNKLI